MGLKALLALLAYVAGAVFLGLLTFSVALGDVNLLAAGLFSVAIGLVLDHAPEPARGP